MLPVRMQTVWRAQSFVNERAGGYNILTSDRAAPYSSPGSAGHSNNCHAINPSGANAFRAFESARASERDLGHYAHVRDVVLTRANMTYFVRVLFKFVEGLL